MIEPLRMPDVTHIAIFRNQYGSVNRRVLLYLPLASDDDATMSAKSMKQVADAYVDVFEIHGTHRTGGWKLQPEI